MVTVDPTRARIRLSEQELAAAAIVHQHGPNWREVAAEADGDVTALHDLALVDDTATLDVVLATALETITVAPVEILVEVLGLGSAAHLGWVSDDHAVVAVDQQDGTHEYTLTDPALVGYALAVVLGVGYRPSPPRRTLTATAADLDQLGADLLENAPADDGGQDLGPELADALTHWRATWRATSRVSTPDGPTLTVYTVVDAGPRGYYRLRELERTVTLEPCRPSDVFSLLHRLFPGVLDEDLP